MFNEQEQFSASLCLPDRSIAFINDDMRVKYDRLNEGLRDKKDPVTWRTTVITLGELIGVQDPENNPASPLLFERGYAITKKLVEGTWQEPLLPEMLLALGFEQARDLPAEKLDVLLINARHNPEELLWTTAEELNNQGLNVAVMNPVGHYNDQETRIVGIGELLRDVENVIIMASTQTQKVVIGWY